MVRPGSRFPHSSAAREVPFNRRSSGMTNLYQHGIRRRDGHIHGRRNVDGSRKPELARRRFGQTLEDLGLLTGEEIAKALAVQLGYKIVSGISDLNIPPEALCLVSMEAAAGLP